MMQKIKRTSVKTGSIGRTLFRILLMLILSGLLMAGGYFAAFYLTRFF